MPAILLSALAQEEDSAQKTRTNLEVIQQLSGYIVDSLKQFLEKGDSVSVSVRPKESAWYIEGSILSSFIQQGWAPTQSDSMPREVEIGLLNARVEYLDVRRDGIFSAKVADRTITVELGTKVVDGKTGVILLSRNFIQDASDTIEVSQIENLENVGIPATRGVLPKEGFFSTILEPVVIVVAVAVAVFLLFRIRS